MKTTTKTITIKLDDELIVFDQEHGTIWGKFLLPNGSVCGTHEIYVGIPSKARAIFDDIIMGSHYQKQLEVVA